MKFKESGKKEDQKEAEPEIEEKPEEQEEVPKAEEPAPVTELPDLSVLDDQTKEKKPYMIKNPKRRGVIRFASLE